MKLNIETLISNEQIENRIQELANTLNKKYKNQTVTLITILTGGVMFMTDLAKKLEFDVIFDFIDISSYGEGEDREKNFDIKLNRDLIFDIKDKNIIIVEDIIDTGKSIKYLVDLLKLRNPKNIEVCTLLDKKDNRLIDGLVVDYIGFSIPNKFVVGYGLDYDQKFRNLPFVGVVK